MDTIKGVYRNGQVVLEARADWPEGTEVLVEPIPRDGAMGIREEDWSDTPDAIADWLTWYDSLEPLEFTAEEEAAIAAWRQKVREHTIANMHKDVEGLFP
jgi:hypothetical protein